MSKKLYLVFVFLLAFTFLGCEHKTASTLKNEETVKLADVLKQIPDYVGKRIVLDGNYFPACSTSHCTDDFTLKSGVDQIKVFTMGNLHLHDVEHAQPLRVAGILRESSESPFLEATVIEQR
jgi:hypothetical protein